MKTNAIILYLSLLLFFFSCRKDQTAANEPIENPDEEMEPFEMPFKIGSYWIYHWYSIDSSGTKVSLGIVDTVTITGDSIINGHTYIRNEGTLMGSSSSSFTRDSSGYIVNHLGSIIYSYVNLGDTLDSYEHPTTLCYYSLMNSSKVNITIPTGTYQAFDKQRHWYYSSEDPVNDCGDYEAVYNSYYVSSIGELLTSTAFTTEMQQCKKRQRELVTFYIP